MTFSFRNNTVFCLLSLLISSCVPLGEPITGSEPVAKTPEYYAQRTLVFEDHIYNELIRTVQFYAGTGTTEDILTPAVLSIEQTIKAVLEFDELSTQQQRFMVKLINCNYDWTQSSLADIQFTTGYNENYITDIRPNGNTKVPFFHYTFTIPPVKISGNYLVVVSYPDGSYALTRRLMVYENLVGSRMDPVISSGVGERFTMQQINIDISYPKLNLVNPSQEVKLVLRQNQRWDNAKYNLTPSFVHDAQHRLEYTYYDLRNNFLGLNEFRVFDTRSLRYTGFNLANIDREANPTEVMLQLQLNRGHDVYAYYPDINGKYIIDNRERGNGDTEGDYAWVNFQVKAPDEAPGTVYVFGGLSDWKIDNNFKLNYNATEKMYTGKALLKQGYYNFTLAVKPPSGPINERYFENSFADTENFYDLLVYYRPPGSRSDLLVGYVARNMNGKR